MKGRWTWRDLAKKTALPKQAEVQKICTESKEKEKAIKKAKTEAETAKFIQYIKQHTGIELTTEYVFHPVRKWRFDFCNVDLKLAIEVDGGAFSNGRHTRGKGFIEDMKKRNAAVCLGWKPIHIVPQERFTEYIITTIKEILNAA